jgi:hypothetical protein
MFSIGNEVKCKRFFADKTYEIDYGYIVGVSAHMIDVRFGDGVTERHYRSAIVK